MSKKKERLAKWAEIERVLEASSEIEAGQRKTKIEKIQKELDRIRSTAIWKIIGKVAAWLILSGVVVFILFLVLHFLVNKPRNDYIWDFINATFLLCIILAPLFDVIKIDITIPEGKLLQWKNSLDLRHKIDNNTCASMNEYLSLSINKYIGRDALILIFAALALIFRIAKYVCQ